MYEKGWNKKLSYVLAFAKDHIMDVTWRYTFNRQLTSKRRTQCRPLVFFNFLNVGFIHLLSIWKLLCRSWITDSRSHSLKTVNKFFIKDTYRSLSNLFGHGIISEKLRPKIKVGRLVQNNGKRKEEKQDRFHRLPLSRRKKRLNRKSLSKSFPIFIAFL